MPNRKNCYVDMEKYFITTHKQKKRYYAKTAIYGSRPWTFEEDKMVIEHSITDTELSKIIRHSVNAIQKRRYRLKKIKKEV